MNDGKLSNSRVDFLAFVVCCRITSSPIVVASNEAISTQDNHETKCSSLTKKPLLNLLAGRKDCFVIRNDVILDVDS
jgi:hypothetical protein